MHGGLKQEQDDEDFHDVHSGLTTQAQRPGPREAAIATVTRWPGSLQRMVRRRGSHLVSENTQANAEAKLAYVAAQ
jgi:hypothetical protein